MPRTSASKKKREAQKEAQTALESTDPTPNEDVEAQRLEEEAKREKEFIPPPQELKPESWEEVMKWRSFGNGHWIQRYEGGLQLMKGAWGIEHWDCLLMLHFLAYYLTPTGGGRGGDGAAADNAASAFARRRGMQTLPVSFGLSFNNHLRFRTLRVNGAEEDSSREWKEYTRDVVKYRKKAIRDSTAPPHYRAKTEAAFKNAVQPPSYAFDLVVGTGNLKSFSSMCLSIFFNNGPPRKGQFGTWTETDGVQFILDCLEEGQLDVANALLTLRREVFKESPSIFAECYRLETTFKEFQYQSLYRDSNPTILDFVRRNAGEPYSWPRLVDSSDELNYEQQIRQIEEAFVWEREESGLQGIHKFFNRLVFLSPTHTFENVLLTGSIFGSDYLNPHWFTPTLGENEKLVHDHPWSAKRRIRRFMMLFAAPDSFQKFEILMKALERHILSSDNSLLASSSSSPAGGSGDGIKETLRTQMLRWIGRCSELNWYNGPVPQDIYRNPTPMQPTDFLDSYPLPAHLHPFPELPEVDLRRQVLLGQTPLIIAVRQEQLNVRMIRWLIQNGAVGSPHWVTLKTILHELLYSRVVYAWQAVINHADPTFLPYLSYECGPAMRQDEQDEIKKNMEKRCKSFLSHHIRYRRQINNNSQEEDLCSDLLKNLVFNSVAFQGLEKVVADILEAFNSKHEDDGYYYELEGENYSIPLAQRFSFSALALHPKTREQLRNSRAVKFSPPSRQDLLLASENGKELIVRNLITTTFRAKDESPPELLSVLSSSCLEREISSSLLWRRGAFSPYFSPFTFQVLLAARASSKLFSLSCDQEGDDRFAGELCIPVASFQGSKYDDLARYTPLEFEECDSSEFDSMSEPKKRTIHPELLSKSNFPLRIATLHPLQDVCVFQVQELLKSLAPSRNNNSGVSDRLTTPCEAAQELIDCSTSLNHGLPTSEIYFDLSSLAPYDSRAKAADLALIPVGPALRGLCLSGALLHEVEDEEQYEAAAGEGKEVGKRKDKARKLKRTLLAVILDHVDLASDLSLRYCAPRLTPQTNSEAASIPFSGKVTLMHDLLLVLSDLCCVRPLTFSEAAIIPKKKNRASRFGLTVEEIRKLEKQEAKIHYKEDPLEHYKQYLAQVIIELAAAGAPLPSISWMEKHSGSHRGGDTAAFSVKSSKILKKKKKKNQNRDEKEMLDQKIRQYADSNSNDILPDQGGIPQFVQDAIADIRWKREQARLASKREMGTKTEHHHGHRQDPLGIGARKKTKNDDEVGSGEDDEETLMRFHSTMSMTMEGTKEEEEEEGDSSSTSSEEMVASSKGLFSALAGRKRR